MLTNSIYLQICHIVFLTSVLIKIDVKIVKLKTYFLVVIQEWIGFDDKYGACCFSLTLA